MKKFIIFLVLFFATGFLTNPDMKDFQDWVENHLESKLEENTDDSALGNLISGTLSQLGAAFSAGIAEEKNLYFCTVYTLDFGEKEYSYLGIFTKFIPLQLENPLEGENKNIDF